MKRPARPARQNSSAARRNAGQSGKLPTGTSVRSGMGVGTEAPGSASTSKKAGSATVRVSGEGRPNTAQAKRSPKATRNASTVSARSAASPVRAAKPGGATGASNGVKRTTGTSPKTPPRGLAATRRPVGRSDMRRRSSTGTGRARRNLPTSANSWINEDALVRIHDDGSRTIRFGSKRRGVDIPVSRVAVLSALIIVTVVMLASPITNWVLQAQQAAQLHAKVQEAKNQNTSLREQIERWKDPEYVSSQARSRLGWVKPGEIRYVVVDPPKDYEEGKTGSANVSGPPQPWFIAVVEQVQLAGEVPIQEQAKKNSKPAEGSKK